MIGEEEKSSMDEEEDEEKQEGRVSIGFSSIRRLSRIDGKGSVREYRIVNVSEVKGGRSVETGSNENEDRVEQKGEREER